MFDFFRENVKYYLKIAWYHYLLYLALLLPLFLFATAGVFLLRKVNIELFNIAVTSIALAPIIIGALFLLALFFKFVFITAYSMTKQVEESGVRWQLVSKIVTKVANPKLLLLAFLILVAGYLIYSQVLSDIERLSSVDRNTILFSVALTLLIYSALAFLFSTRHIFIHLIIVLWEFLPGALWKVFILFVIIASQLVLLGLIYILVSTFVAPMILA